MTPIQLALMIFGIMLLLMVVRVPIAGAMFLAGTAGFILQTGIQPFLNFLNKIFLFPAFSSVYSPTSVDTNKPPLCKTESPFGLSHKDFHSLSFLLKCSVNLK